MSIKVLLVEDHELTRKGIAYGLKVTSGIEVVGEAENGKQALDFVKTNQPDIILMDVSMPVMNGIEATKKILEKNPDIKVVMLSSVSEKNSVLSAFNSGAHAYCMKDVRSDELVKIIQMVQSGALWIAPSIASYIVEILQSKSKFQAVGHHCCEDFNLTTREKEILKLIADGLSNQEIADNLFLSLHTVKNHVKNVIQKLSVKDRTQAAVLALKENLI